MLPDSGILTVLCPEQSCPTDRKQLPWPAQADLHCPSSWQQVVPCSTKLQCSALHPAAPLALSLSCQGALCSARTHIICCKEQKHIESLASSILVICCRHW